MTHSEVSQIFLIWFQNNYPGDYAFQNNTGYASVEHVKYGIPTSGGGFDFICFGGDAETMFFEIKTIKYPTLSKKQKHFRDQMIKKGFKCWVFKELLESPGYYVIPAQDYRPIAKWPY